MDQRRRALRDRRTGLSNARIGFCGGYAAFSNHTVKNDGEDNPQPPTNANF